MKRWDYHSGIDQRTGNPGFVAIIFVTQQSRHGCVYAD
jgi:hypothetical protein